MARRTVSIKDVAAASGVSIATVSNVLNNRRFVSEELKQRVYKAVDELDYTVNPIARSMRASKSFAVGVVVLDLNCIFFAPMLKGIQKVMSRAGYSVIMYDSNYSMELEMKYSRMLANSMVDGIILAGISTEENSMFYSSLRSSTGRSMLPIISIENNLSDIGIDSVYIDNEKASYTATSHMIELGCKRIAHIKAPQTTTSNSARLRGYRKALMDSGLECDPSLELDGDFSAASGYQAALRLIRAGKNFDGIFAANDQMAVGAMRALHNYNINIPGEVKIVGFDNTFVASIMDPALTTIRVPNYQMGVSAAQCLLRRIQNPQEKVSSIQMEYELIIRRSTMASAQTNWDMVYW